MINNSLRNYHCLNSILFKFWCLFLILFLLASSLVFLLILMHCFTFSLQINLVTSWIDGSFIYSTSETWLNTMRSFKNGTFRSEANGLYPPRNRDRAPLINSPPAHYNKMISPERMYRKYYHSDLNAYWWLIPKWTIQFTTMLVEAAYNVKKRRKKHSNSAESIIKLLMYQDLGVRTWWLIMNIYIHVCGWLLLKKKMSFRIKLENTSQKWFQFVFSGEDIEVITLDLIIWWVWIQERVKLVSLIP